MTYIQQVTYVVDGSSTEVTEEVTASTPTAAKIPIIATTTKSSINVKPLDFIN